jgi:hypothetical protein
MKRSLVESLDQRKERMIAALWANSGFEGQDGANARREAIEELELHYDEAVEQIHRGIDEQPEEEIDRSNPFWSSMDRGMEKILTPIREEGTVQEALESEGQYQYMNVDQ